MKHFLLLIAFVCWFCPQNVYAQDQTLPQLSQSMMNDNGLLNFSTSDGWKYQPGDDLQWADPEFDDSQWYDIAPGDLGIDAMPDSLWNGYGWWRYTFTADSSLYDENWNLYFFGWGAAEVYLDGERVHRFGNFSVDPDKERTFSPIAKFHPPIKITENDTHTVAVRYSHHQAKSYNTIIKVNAENLGFGFGFGTHALNQYTAQINTYNSFTIFVSAAVLFVLLLLHLMLFYKFPEDRSNLFISVIVALLFISVLLVYSYVALDVTAYSYSFLILLWSFSNILVVVFLPYTIAELFKLEEQKKVLWLIAALPLFAVSSLLNAPFNDFLFLLIMSVSVFLVGYICWKAYKSGKRGVQYVAMGVIGTLSFGIVYGFYLMGILELSVQVFFVMVTFIYILFPLGMTLYVADSYGYLFTSLESEITDRTKKLNQSLDELMATQSQLIQQEKLASLGQLTAGIAHEIKNPLNFVNNFSEVSIEMIDEIREELALLGKEIPASPLGISTPSNANSNSLHQTISEILDDIEANLRKIHEHGTRADGIVKSMLLHSRGGTGKMEPSPLNSIIKEYVNLAFHGMRAGKDPINVDIQMDLDDSIGEIPMIAEDFSRVILNLCNNAFDAMREVGGGTHKPKLTVRTSRNAEKAVTIEIEDNGPGIPADIKDKILQPFFTTKKGTQGTGLGLSITNDIVKAHGGTIDINSKQNEFTLFRVTLTQNEIQT